MKRLATCLALTVACSFASAVDAVAQVTPEMRAEVRSQIKRTCSFTLGEGGSYQEVGSRIRRLGDQGIVPQADGTRVVKYACRQINANFSDDPDRPNDWQLIGIGISRPGGSSCAPEKPEEHGCLEPWCQARYAWPKQHRRPEDVAAYRAIRAATSCPTATAARTRIFARGDKALIRRMVRQRARENGWRRVGFVEFTSPSNDGTFSTANLIVTASKAGKEQCEALARWTPGTGYVLILQKDALLENTGQCVPEEDPR
jgi:hypothetical protein